MGFHVNGTDPAPAHQPYDQPPPPDRTARSQATARRTALTLCTIAEIAAGLPGLWIVLHLLDSTQGNPFVEFVHGTADWLSEWAQDIFTMDTEGLRVVLNYGLPAGIHLLLGHGIAARIDRAWRRRRRPAPVVHPLGCGPYGAEHITKAAVGSMRAPQRGKRRPKGH